MCSQPKLHFVKHLPFSLIEVSLAISIFLILIIAIFTFFSTAQKTWTITTSRQEAFENARIALDLISKDLECSYFGEDEAPFWHWNPLESNGDPLLPSAWGEYRNELLAFVSRSPIPPNELCQSHLYEVKYQLYYSTEHDENEGWLRRSITGDITDDGLADNKWNWKENYTVGYTAENNSSGIPIAAFTADSESSEDYHNVIPYVLDLSFICDTDTASDSVIPPDQTTSTTADSYLVNSQQPYYPVFVTVSLTLMDKSSWEKWISLCGSNVCHAPEYENEPDAAASFRENNQIVLSKSIFLGNRGQ